MTPERPRPSFPLFSSGDRAPTPEREEALRLIEEIRDFCRPLCVPEDTKEAQAADYALQACDLALSLAADLETAERSRSDCFQHAKALTRVLDEQARDLATAQARIEELERERVS